MRLSDLPKMTQLVRTGVGIYTQAVWLRLELSTSSVPLPTDQKGYVQ